MLDVSSRQAQATRETQAIEAFFWNYFSNTGHLPTEEQVEKAHRSLCPPHALLGDLGARSFVGCGAKQMQKPEQEGWQHLGRCWGPQRHRAAPSIPAPHLLGSLPRHQGHGEYSNGVGGPGTWEEREVSHVLQTTAAPAAAAGVPAASPQALSLAAAGGFPPKCWQGQRAPCPLSSSFFPAHSQAVQKASFKTKHCRGTITKQPH